MGVITEADRQLETVKKSVENAIAALSKVVVEQCWGWDEYCKEARDTQAQIFYELLDIRNRMSG